MGKTSRTWNPGNVEDFTTQWVHLQNEKSARVIGRDALARVMALPIVSVVISTYERAGYLDRALASVQAQTYKNYEIIIVHDGPAPEDVVAVCSKWHDKFAENATTLTLVSLDENSGYQCVPKNTGTWLARGDYIAYLDDDNEWLPEHLEALVAEIEAGHDWPDFVYGRRYYKIDEGYTPDKTLNIREGELKFIQWTPESQAMLDEGPTYNFIDSSDLLIGKGALWRCFLATGKMWNEELRRFADWELIVRGSRFSGWRGRGVDKTLSIYHWHGKNIQITRPVNETPKQQVGA